MFGLARLWRERPAIRGYALLSPTLILMVVALISPFLLLVGRSFVVETGVQDEWIVSLANYETFFEKSQYLRVLWRSVLVHLKDEEFLLLLPETGPSEASLVVERMRLMLSRQPAYASDTIGPLIISFSAGIAAHPTSEAVTAEHLIEFADEALFVAKRSGRNRVCMASGLSVQDLEDTGWAPIIERRLATLRAQ